MSSTDQFFQQLDAPLSGLSVLKAKTSKGTEPISWATSDFLIQYQFELPLPIITGSTVKYSE